MKNNYKKIVLSVIFLFLIGFLFIYVPFFNSFFGPSIGLVAVVWFWFLLFNPQINYLITVGIALAMISGIFSLFQLDGGFLGDIIFSIMIFILIRFFHQYLVEN